MQSIYKETNADVSDLKQYNTEEKKTHFVYTGNSDVTFIHILQTSHDYKVHCAILL